MLLYQRQELRLSQPSVLFTNTQHVLEHVRLNQVPGVHVGSHKDPPAGCHVHHPVRRSKRCRNAAGLELHQGKMGLHFPAVRTHPELPHNRSHLCLANLQFVVHVFTPFAGG